MVLECEARLGLVKAVMTTRLRKRPVQARSRKRFEAILDAAAEQFAVHGLDKTTMDAIAAAAGTSIGSVYQYFPDKDAVFLALAERVLERSRELFDALIPAMEAARPPWETLLDRVIEGFALITRDASVRAVWRNLQLHGEVAEADAALHEELIVRTTEILTWYAPAASPEARRAVATMTVDVVGAVLFIGILRDDERTPRMREELRLLLQRYLEPWIAEHQSR